MFPKTISLLNQIYFEERRSANTNLKNYPVMVRLVLMTDLKTWKAACGLNWLWLFGNAFSNPCEWPLIHQMWKERPDDGAHLRFANVLWFYTHWDESIINLIWLIGHTTYSII